MDSLWGKRFFQNRVNPYGNPPKDMPFRVSVLFDYFLFFLEVVSAISPFRYIATSPSKIRKVEPLMI